MSANSQYQLERMSQTDKQTLETIGMKLRDDRGELRAWEDIVTDFVTDVLPTFSEEQKTDAMLLIALVRYRLENGFTWD